MTQQTSSELTLGPVLYNWKPDIWRDFYFRMADEAPLDTVFVGEVVCSKRLPLYGKYIPEVIDRLEAAGKIVILSTLALILNDKDMGLVRDLAEDGSYLVEANDMSACALLKGRKHAVGPFVNVYNEGTLGYLVDQGATRICLPGELPQTALAALASSTPARLEVQAFGRQPLAISARCYHARSHGLSKDSCQFVCDRDPDGMDLDTLDGDPFLAVNGVQTMSYTATVLMDELATLQEMGISTFRLSPQDTDMVAVSRLYRDVLAGTRDSGAAVEELSDLMGGLSLSNGFFHGVEGLRAEGPLESYF